MDEPAASDRHYPTGAEVRAKERAWEDVPTPELGEGWFIRVGVFSARARLSLEAAVVDAPKEDLPGLVISRSAIDPLTGARNFTDEDAAWINEADWNWVARVTNVAARLNGIAIDSVERAVKN